MLNSFYKSKHLIAAVLIFAFAVFNIPLYHFENTVDVVKSDFIRESGSLFGIIKICEYEKELFGNYQKIHRETRKHIEKHSGKIRLPRGLALSDNAAYGCCMLFIPFEICSILILIIIVYIFHSDGKKRVKPLFKK